MRPATLVAPRPLDTPSWERSVTVSVSSSASADQPVPSLAAVAARMEGAVDGLRAAIADLVQAQAERRAAHDQLAALDE